MYRSPLLGTTRVATARSLAASRSALTSSHTASDSELCPPALALASQCSIEEQWGEQAFKGHTR